MFCLEKMSLSEICVSYFKRVINNPGFNFYTENIHWFLIPAVLFAIAWSFLEKRQSFKTNILGGRPALYRVINLLDGGVRDRWGTSFIFGAMTALISSLIFKMLLSDSFPLWATVVFVYAQALEAAFFTLPFFVCLSTRFRLLGGIIGLLYALGWAVLSLYVFVVPVKCFVEAKMILETNVTDYNSKNLYDLMNVTVVFSVIAEAPGQICFVCIVGKFINRLYDCIKTGEYTRQDTNELQARTSEIYVKYLMDPVGTNATQSIPKKYLERITHYIPGFTYPNHIFSTSFMMAILLFQIILAEQYVVYAVQRTLHTFSEHLVLGETFEKYRILYILQGCGIASGIATGIYGCSVIYSLLMTYKRHILMLYKGERKFLPEGMEKEKPETHLIRSTQYMGYQIAGMVYGTMICFVSIFLPLCLLCIVFRLVEVRNQVPHVLEQFQIFVYPVSVLIIFRLQIFMVGKFLLQERLNATDQERPLAIDNRKAHDLFKFFMLFVNLNIGIIVFLWRLISTLILGIFIVPRMDRSLLPMGFENDDKCYMNYVSMLMVDFTHNNPIMRVFCSILLKTVPKKPKQRNNANSTATYGAIETRSIIQLQGHSRARTRWLLAYTLMRNPAIKEMRKNALPGIVLMELPNTHADVINRVQRSIVSKMFIYIGMAVLLLIITFLYFGCSVILKS